MNVIPTEADRIEREIAESLGLDLERIVAGSLRFELAHGEKRGRVRWDGFAYVDAEVLLEIVHRNRADG